MYKGSLLMLLTVIPMIEAAEGSSLLNQAVACMKNRWVIAGTAVAVGTYVAYRWLASEVEQEEERVFEEHAQENETFEVTKKDAEKIYALIDAMEKDIQDFKDQPERSSACVTDGFDDPEFGNGCEGFKSAFCILYEQTKAHPENKPFLEEFLMIFKQVIDQNMIVV